MLEYYEAYGDQFTAADRMRDIIVNAAEASGAGTKLVDYRGHEIDLSGEWRWLPIADAVAEAVGEEVSIDETPENAARLRALADAREVNVKPDVGCRRDHPRAVRAAGRGDAGAADVRLRLPASRCAPSPARTARSRARSRPGT